MQFFQIVCNLLDLLNKRIDVGWRTVVFPTAIARIRTEEAFDLS